MEREREMERKGRGRIIDTWRGGRDGKRRIEWVGKG
jgi:hypothetical protein